MLLMKQHIYWYIMDYCTYLISWYMYMYIPQYHWNLEISKYNKLFFLILKLQKLLQDSKSTKYLGSKENACI